MRLTVSEFPPICNHSRAVEYLISEPMLNTVTKKIINCKTPGKSVLFR